VRVGENEFVDDSDSTFVLLDDGMTW
jgi:hypothetical protein